MSSRPSYLIHGPRGVVFYSFEFDDVLVLPLEGDDTQYAVQLVRTSEKLGRYASTVLVGDVASCAAAVARIAAHVSLPSQEPVIDLVDLASPTP